MPKPEKLKIRFLLPSLNLGGSEKHVIRLASGLREKGHDVGIATLFREGFLLDEVLKEGIPFECLKIKSGWLLSPFHIFEWLQKERPDVLHTYLFGFHFFAGLAARLAGIPLVLSSRRDVEYGQRKRDLFIESLGNLFVDRVICCAKAAQRRASEKEFWLSPEKLNTIYNGVDLERFKITHPEKIRKEFDIPDNVPVIGTVGNLSHKKGTPFLLDAMGLIIPAHPHARFLLVGAGPLEKEMKEKAIHLAPRGQIIFTGPRSDIPDLMSAMDIFVLASLFEGLPNVLLEAMTLGKPVIATQVGGIPELIESRGDGILVPPQNPQELARAVLTLLEDPSRAKAMGERGQEKIKTHFLLGRMVDQYDHLYYSLARAKGMLIPEGKPLCVES